MSASRSEACQGPFIPLLLLLLLSSASSDVALLMSQTGWVTVDVLHVP